MKRLLCILGLAGSVASAAPLPLDLPRLNGEGQVSLNSFKHRPVILNFWASNCVPCVAELPLLNAQAARQRHTALIGIAIDERQAALGFLQQHPATYEQAHAVPPATLLMGRFGNQIRGLPYTVILNSEHEVCTRRLGRIDAQWLAKAVAACT